MSLMTSSSSTSTTDPQQKHQVFLSFRGEDTRNTFLSHLNEALRRKGIGTYIDSKELQRGEQISLALLTAIEESTISVIVFSQNYAFSSWCLEELSQIMEFKVKKGLIVVPIFYHVDPSDVRKQTESFQKAFAGHEENRMDKVQKWRDALTQAGHLSGFHIRGDEPEPTIIEEIVQDVLRKLNRMSPSDCEGLIGIGPKIEQIKSLLCLDDRENSRMIGIWGMGGIGKTTLAQAVYDEVFAQFDSYYFLANVRESLEKFGANKLRDELLSKILDEENLHISTPRIGLTITKDRLRQKRVLLVLDDVTDFEQLEALGVSPLHALGPGSRIILTTRDKHVLEEGFDAPYIYEVQGLNKADSIRLFSLNAFKQDHPVKDFTDVLNRALRYAQGVPIALKVLGSALCGKRKQYWQSVLNKLKENPNPKILNVLKISFDGLDDAQKEIFLDIACTFKGHKLDQVTKIVGDDALCGIEELVDKCLLNIDKYDDALQMHDLIQQMGMDVVRSESKTNPGKRSRLWTYEDVYLVLKHDKGTEAIRSIVLDMTNIRQGIQVSPTAFDRMLNLKFLKFEDRSYAQSKFMLCPQGLESLPDKLRYLHWDYFPLKSLPSDFIPEDLVELKLPWSSIEQLWDREQNLVNLRVLDLGGCINLIRIPDLSQAINLEELYLTECESLVELWNGEQNLVNLRVIRLIRCRNLIRIPDLFLTINLEELCLRGCESLIDVWNGEQNLVNLRVIDLAWCKNLTMIPDLSQAIHLEKLYLTECESLVEPWNGEQNLVNLRVLRLDGCRNLTSIPDLSQAINLEGLYLSGCKSLVELRCLNHLKYLTELGIGGCSNLKKFPEVPYHLPELILRGTRIEEVPDWIEYLQVRDLDLSDSNIKNVSSNIYKLGSLKHLILTDCPITEFPEVPFTSCSLKLRSLFISGTRIQHIPSNILKSLEYLDVQDCKYLKSLQELPRSVESLLANGCTSLEEVSFTDHNETSFWESDHQSTFGHCFNLNQNAIKNIVDNALLRIQCFAKQSAKEFPPGSGVLQCHFPRSEIPERFEHQSPNSSINVKLEPTRCSSRFLGFALCIVVHFADKNYESLFVDGECKLRSIDNADDHIFQFSWECHLIDEDHLQHPDLVSIHFNGQDMFCENKLYEASFNFYRICPHYPPSCPSTDVNIVVKKCGVHPVYVDANEAGDFEDLAPRMDD